jgi:hypothetical protein
MGSSSFESASSFWPHSTVSGGGPQARDGAAPDFGEAAGRHRDKFFCGALFSAEIFFLDSEPFPFRPLQTFERPCEERETSYANKKFAGDVRK